MGGLGTTGMGLGCGTEGVSGSGEGGVALDSVSGRRGGGGVIVSALRMGLAIALIFGARKRIVQRVLLPEGHQPTTTIRTSLVSVRTLTTEDKSPLSVRSQRPIKNMHTAATSPRQQLVGQLTAVRQTRQFNQLTVVDQPT